MKPLTTKQYALLRYMYDYEREHGYPALIKELADYFGVGRVAIKERLQVLNRNGYIAYKSWQPVHVTFMPGMGEIKRAA